VRALEQQRVVHLNLTTGPAPSSGEPAYVHVALSMPTNVTTVSRLADGITRASLALDPSTSGRPSHRLHRLHRLLAARCSLLAGPRCSPGDTTDRASPPQG
jgi:hypothetical protein